MVAAQDPTTDRLIHGGDCVASPNVWQPYPSFRAFLDLPHSARLPIWRELRVLVERSLGSLYPVEPPPAYGRAVLLIPGFLSSDKALTPLGRWLTGGGWTVHGSGLTNSACGAVVAEKMGRRLHAVTESQGERVTVIGHSRGGQIAHVLAVRFPHLVSEVITLASPLSDPFAMHISLRLVAAGCSLLTRAGVPGLVDRCPFGTCCQQFHDDLLVASECHTTSLFSRSDGIVDWRACVRGDADNIEVKASHLGIVNNDHARQILARTLTAHALSPWQRARSGRRRRCESR